MHNNTVILSFLLSLSLGLFGQTKKHSVRFTNFNTNLGLSNDWVNCIEEDDRGFMWTGTRSGLNIFDGTHNTIISNNSIQHQGLSSNDVSCLLFTKNKTMLVGTWGGGINIINPYTFEVKLASEEELYKKLTIKKIIRQSDSTAWVLTFGEGIFSYNINDNNFTKYSQPNHNGNEDKLFNHTEDAVIVSDTLWLVNNKGKLGFVPPGTNQVECYSDYFALDTQIKNPTSVLEHNGSHFIMGTVEGEIFYFDHHNKEISEPFSLKKQPNQKLRVNDILHDDYHKVIWISTIHGLFKYDIRLKKVVELVSGKNDDKYDENFCSMKDSRGYVWFGTWGSGINYYSSNTIKFHKVPLDKKTKVKHIYPLSDSALLIGTNKGLVKYGRKNHLHKPFKVTGKNSEKINQSKINNIFLFDNHLAIDCEGIGLTTISKKGEVLDQLLPPEFNGLTITSLELLANGDYFLGTLEQGMLLLKKGTNTIETLSNQKVLSIKESADGKIWVGKENGLYNYNEKRFIESGIVLRIEGETSALKSITNITEDKNGNLWIATKFGLVKYEKAEQLETLISTSNGLPDNNIMGLLLIDRHLWVTTQNGLSRIDIESNDIANFNISSGLPSNEFNFKSVYYSENEHLAYLGSKNDLVVFDPREHALLKDDEVHVLLNKVIIYDGSETNEINSPDINSNDKLRNLRHNENTLSINVSIQDFARNTNGKKYLFKLDGFDKEWLENNYQEKLIKYTNLDPGRYILHVAPLDENGQIGDDHKQLTIIIKTPFWKEWWFVTLMTVFTFLILYLMYKKRTKDILRQNSLLEKAVEERTQEIKKRNDELKEQKEALNSNLTYASTIQQATLASERNIKEKFPDHFVFFKPRDVVSGDFYWISNIGSKTVFVVADCTGHGVSGSFVSIMGVNFLESIVNSKNITSPNLILKELNKMVSKTFVKRNGNTLNDGMDISVLCYDKEKETIELSSAMNSVVIKSVSGEFERHRGDRRPIGGSGYDNGKERSYSLVTLNALEIDMIYLFSDGYQDQFGGEDGSKYMQKRFRQLLADTSKSSPKQQLSLLEEEFYEWKGALNQIDDVLVVGLKIPKS